jgi:hypothetical protein
MFGVSLGIIDSGGAGGAAGAFESIATFTPTSGSVTFSSIPSTYKHLQVRYNFMGTNGNNITMRLNGDTGSNYSSHRLGGTGSSTSSYGIAAQTNIQVMGWFGGTVINNPNVAIIDLHDYASTTKNKTVRIISGADDNSSGSIGLFSGLWLNTAAVNSITITLVGTSAGSVFSLYGIKG